MQKRTIYRIVGHSGVGDFTETLKCGPEECGILDRSAFSKYYIDSEYDEWITEYDTKEEAQTKLKTLHNEYKKVYSRGHKRYVLIATEYWLTAVELERENEEDEWVETNDTYDYNATETQHKDWIDFYNEIHGEE